MQTDVDGNIYLYAHTYIKTYVSLYMHLVLEFMRYFTQNNGNLNVHLKDAAPEKAK